MTQFQSTGTSHHTVYLTFTNHHILFQDLSCDCHLNWDYETNYTDGLVNICFALYQNSHQMVWENLFAMPKRFKIGNSVNPNLCQLLLNTQMEFETNPCDICQTLNVSDKPKHLKLGHTYHGLHQKSFLVYWKVYTAGVKLTYWRATGSVLTEPAAASSRMEMSGARECAQYNHCNSKTREVGYEARFSSSWQTLFGKCERSPYH